jgi:S1-C subfamily serine protease
MDGVLDGLLSSIRSLNEDAPRAADVPYAPTRARPLPSAAEHNAPFWHARSARSALVRSETMNGGTCGIGAKIGQQGRHVVITAICCDGPADRGGVTQGDIIRQVRRAQGSGFTVWEGLRCRAPSVQPPI